MAAGKSGRLLSTRAVNGTARVISVEVLKPDRFCLFGHDSSTTAAPATAPHFTCASVGGCAGG